MSDYLSSLNFTSPRYLLHTLPAWMLAKMFITHGLPGGYNVRLAIISLLKQPAATCHCPFQDGCDCDVLYPWTYSTIEWSQPCRRQWNVGMEGKEVAVSSNMK